MYSDRAGVRVVWACLSVPMGALHIRVAKSSLLPRCMANVNHGISHCQLNLVSDTQALELGLYMQSCICILLCQRLIGNGTNGAFCNHPLNLWLNGYTRVCNVHTSAMVPFSRIYSLFRLVVSGQIPWTYW